MATTICLVLAEDSSKTRSAGSVPYNQSQLDIGYWLYKNVTERGYVLFGDQQQPSTSRIVVVLRPALSNPKSGKESDPRRHHKAQCSWDRVNCPAGQGSTSASPKTNGNASEIQRACRRQRPRRRHAQTEHREQVGWRCRTLSTRWNSSHPRHWDLD